MVDVLSIVDFYSQVDEYMARVDSTWLEEDFQASLDNEKEIFAQTLGTGDGRSVLDCTCGKGPQAVALAKLGWQVTATDLTPKSVEDARINAARANVDVSFEVLDIRELSSRFRPSFDQVVTCMALDNAGGQVDIALAVKEMYAVLKPGGECYIRLRNIEQVIEDCPRYEFKSERKVPYGRVIHIEDWEFPTQDTIIHIDVFLREDSRHPDYWDTDVFAYQRNALKKQALARMLEEAGFQEISFLPFPHRWHPYEVIARKPV